MLRQSPEVPPSVFANPPDTKTENTRGSVVRLELKRKWKRFPSAVHDSSELCCLTPHKLRKSPHAAENDWVINHEQTNHVGPLAVANQS